MTSNMEFVVSVDGVARYIYDEALDLQKLGDLRITRACHVEPDRDGFWWADMEPVLQASVALGRPADPSRRERRARACYCRREDQRVAPWASGRCLSADRAGV